MGHPIVGEGIVSGRRLADDVEGAAPAGLVEDVDEDVAHEGDAVGDGGLVDLVGGGLEGPVDEHGPADDVFAGDESPEAAVEGLGAVVAHGEDFAGWDDEVAVDDVVGQVERPVGGDVRRWDRRGRWGSRRGRGCRRAGGRRRRRAWPA